MGLRKARERRSKARAGGGLLRGGRGRGRHLRRRRYGAGRSRSSGSSCCGWTLFLGGASRRLRRLYCEDGSELMDGRAVAEDDRPVLVLFAVDSGGTRCAPKRKCEKAFVLCLSCSSNGDVEQTSDVWRNAAENRGGVRSGWRPALQRRRTRGMCWFVGRKEAV